MYGEYPDSIVADAGYGSYENYNYCFSKGIKGIIKYSGHEKRKQKVTEKNMFKLSHMDRTEDGVPICPAGHAFDLDKVKLTYKGIYPMTACYYRNNHCDGCPLRKKCTKAKGGRTARIVPMLENMYSKIDEYLKTDKGQEHMRNRNIQAEGAFANIKQDFEYARLHRRGESGVAVELSLVCIGYNLRKYHNRKIATKMN